MHVQGVALTKLLLWIDGQPVGLDVRKSADELLRGPFKQNEKKCRKVTVSISNIYNKLTGGLIINTQAKQLKLLLMVTQAMP